MTYVLIESDKDVSELIPVNQTKLSLQQALNVLLTGGVLVVSKYEQTKGVDVFVQLTTTEPQMTQISYTAPDKATWQAFPLPLNALTLYRVYEYDASIYGSVVYQVGDTIHYQKDGIKQVGLVNAVYKDADGVYYDIGGKLYQVGTIPDTIILDSNISGNIDLISPVADETADYHTISVSDYKNKIYTIY